MLRFSRSNKSLEVVHLQLRKFFVQGLIEAFIDIIFFPEIFRVSVRGLGRMSQVASVIPQYTKVDEKYEDRERHRVAIDV